MALPALYTFDGTGAGIGANWTIMVGGIDRLGGIGIGVDFESNNEARWSADAFGDNHYAQITVINNAHGYGPIVRASGTAGGRDGYVLFRPAAVNTLEVLRINGGTYNLIATRIPTFGDGDVIRLEAVGAVLRVKVNGIQQGADIDITGGITSGGAAGINLYSTAGQIDNFEADNLAGGGGGLAVDDGGVMVTPVQSW